MGAASDGWGGVVGGVVGGAMGGASGGWGGVVGGVVGGAGGGAPCMRKPLRDPPIAGSVAVSLPEEGGSLRRH